MVGGIHRGAPPADNFQTPDSTALKDWIGDKRRGEYELNKILYENLTHVSNRIQRLF
jgi:hypothetical protein